MKKSTKKALAALAIILLFGMSTIAFVVSSITDTQQNQVKPLDSFIIDVPIDPQVESIYINNHYTFLIYAYKEKDVVYYYLEDMPQLMALPGGQTQLFVNRLQGNETKMEIINLNGANEVTNITESNVYDALCQYLMYTPTDCLLQNIDLTQTSIQPNASANATA